MKYKMCKIMVIYRDFLEEPGKLRPLTCLHQPPTPFFHIKYISRLFAIRFSEKVHFKLQNLNFGANFET